MAQEATRDRPDGPIGNEILFENEQVRVWAMNVPPGDKKAWHRHELPYVIVPLTGGTFEIESVDGKIVRPQETVGEALWRDPGEVHELRNLGDAVYRNVLIEIKTPAK